MILRLTDKDEIDQKVEEVMATVLVANTIPDVLYHYTSFAGFQAIIETGLLRATNIEYLNDEREIQHAIDVFRDRAGILAAQSSANPQKAWLEHAKKKLEENRYQLKPMTFVSCFSSAADDLSQWRAYGSDQGGVSIGFSSRQLMERIERFGGIIVPAIYSNKLQESVCDELLVWASEKGPARALEQGAEASQKYLEFWNNYLSGAIENLVCMFKHPSFAPEQEWRIIYPNRKLHEISYLAKGNHLSMHIDVDLSGSPTFTEEQISWIRENNLRLPDASDSQGFGFRTLPIDSLWMGPGPMKWESYRSAQYFCWSRGYLASKFRATASPLRSVR